MPKQTLLFAASLLDEIITTRNTLPKELTLEDIESINQAEVRFQTLLLELAELPIIQLALPKLLDDEVHLIAFLLAILNEESIVPSRLMAYIEAQVVQNQVFSHG